MDITKADSRMIPKKLSKTALQFSCNNDEKEKKTFHSNNINLD